MVRNRLPLGIAACGAWQRYFRNLHSKIIMQKLLPDVLRSNGHLNEGPKCRRSNVLTCNAPQVCPEIHPATTTDHHHICATRCDRTTRPQRLSISASHAITEFIPCRSLFNRTASSLASSLSGAPADIHPLPFEASIWLTNVSPCRLRWHPPLSPLSPPFHPMMRPYHTSCLTLRIRPAKARRSPPISRTTIQNHSGKLHRHMRKCSQTIQTLL